MESCITIHRKQVRQWVRSGRGFKQCQGLGRIEASNSRKRIETCMRRGATRAEEEKADEDLQAHRRTLERAS